LEEGLDLPYSYDKVWEAALSIVKDARWDVIREDKASGQIEMHVVMDLITWTETFWLNFSKNIDGTTRVVMGRAGLAQPLDWGIARQHIEQFLVKLESNLSNPQ
jgi:hypothetical protein